MKLIREKGAVNLRGQTEWAEPREHERGGTEGAAARTSQSVGW